MGRRSYRVRKYVVGQTLLTLRSRTHLTQIELAALLGVSKRSVLNWEGGESYPKEGHLRQLIALFVARGVFLPGQERAEAEELWERTGEDAPQRLGLFDRAWFDQLLVAHSARQPEPTAQTITSAAHPAADRQRMKSARPVATGLPFQPPPFIGRDTELAEIARIIGNPACRLLTLLGPGGIGKTRLGLAVAAAQTEAFAGNVVFVGLAPVGTPNQIVSAIGEALHLSFGGQSDLVTQLLGYLRGRHMLLLLDNFEHLLAGADLVHAILANAPQISILVTSRERLNLQAEWLFDVEGLAYPSRDSRERATPCSLADIADYSAIQLFV